jgi:hypothetical protein
MSSDKARRQAAYRQRQAVGATVLSVVVPHYELVEALLEAERTTIVDALDRRGLARAVGELVEDFVRRWRKA